MSTEEKVVPAQETKPAEQASETVSATETQEQPDVEKQPKQTFHELFSVDPTIELDTTAASTEAQAADETKSEKTLTEEEQKAADAVQAEEQANTDEAKKAEEAERLKKEEEEKEKAVSIPTDIQTLFPEAKEIAQVVEQVNKLKSDAAGYKASNDEVIALLSKHPALVNILRAVKNDTPLYEAIRTTLELEQEEVIPDPAAEPEQYRVYVRKQLALEEKQRVADAENIEREKKITAAREHAEQVRKSFQEKNKVADAELVQFLNFIQNIVYGDPYTFKLPDNYLDVMYKAYNFDGEMKKADDEKKKEIQKAVVQGRNEAITNITTKKPIGDGLPSLRSATNKTVIVDELSPLEQSIKSGNKDFVTEALGL